MIQSMAVGYAIVRSRDGRVSEVMWSAEAAAEYVEQLNLLASDGSEPYSWQEVWVDGPPEQRPPLTPTDHEKLGYAKELGLLGTEVQVRVAFSFIFNLDGARAACVDLGELGWPDFGIDEELEGDRCWHAYAHQLPLVLNEYSIAVLRQQMEEIAERHGGSFDEWDLSHGSGLRARVERKKSE
jgi:hypothetical protein